MFKNSPFVKGKESKNIVGRVVEVGGNQNDENVDPSYKSKGSKSTQKIVSSVSRIFGASPYKKTSTTRTPGRKLLKKLVCTPGKARSVPGTSATDIDELGAFPSISRSYSVDEAREISSIQASIANQKLSSPPKLARRILEEEDMNRNMRSNQMMQATRTAQNHHISHKRVDEALVAASDRASANDDMIFMTHSSSSSEDADYRNENESSQMPRTEYSSPYSSPQQHSSQSNGGRFAMRSSPGMSIPTPAMGRLNSNGGLSNGISGSEVPFPHPLGSIQDSPMDKMNSSTPNPRNLNSQFEEEDDDDAFLPDDFINPKENQSTQGGEKFTQEQVEQQIRDAIRKERLALRKEHEIETNELRSEFEQVLLQSGTQWQNENVKVEASLQKLLKEEKHKTSELVNQTQSLQENLNEVETERELLNRKVLELERIGEAMAQAASYNAELDALENEDRTLVDRIAYLGSRFQGFGSLAREKDASEKRNAELSEEVRALKESSEQSQSQLEQAMEVVNLLKGKLAELPSVDPEEIRNSKIEVENLRNLRVVAGKGFEALQTQLSHIIEEHKDCMSPRKQRLSLDVSPPVGETDILKVNYDKSQEQLKSMGKVLKRYRTQRDDFKAELELAEERHVSAIEIAVKESTQHLKDEIQSLKEENEAIQQKKQDIGEKMAEEMKNHMEDLKRSHEEEVRKLREMLEKQTRSAEEKQETMKAEFETNVTEMKMNHEQKMNSLTQEMSELRSNQNDELSRAKTNADKEIDSIRNELDRIRTDFEDEKLELQEQKAAECKALEDQIKSMSELHKEELELTAAESLEQIDSLKEQISKLEADLLAKASEGLTKGDFEQMKSGLEDDLQKAKAEQDRLLVQLKSLQEAKDAEAEKSNSLESQILEIKSESAAAIEKVKSDYDRQIHEVKSEHASESDELLTQLDLIEAEAAQRFQSAQENLNEKDAVITALGSQLAVSEAKVASTSQQYEALKKEIDSLRNDLLVVTASNESSEKEIAKLIQQHEKEIEEQVALRESACNEAREEMIALAEGQLAERNQYYQALKKELDNSQSKTAVLERDLRFTKKELDEIGKRHDAREADLRDELAQCKASIATEEAKRKRAEKIHQAELERARQAEMDMKEKYDESKKTSHSIQKTLAKLVTEKQVLEQELAEVTAISEELATICEKNKLM